MNHFFRCIGGFIGTIAMVFTIVAMTLVSLAIYSLPIVLMVLICIALMKYIY